MELKVITDQLFALGKPIKQGKQIPPHISGVITCLQVVTKNYKVQGLI